MNFPKLERADHDGTGPIAIYALCDPRTMGVLYVGQSLRPRMRLLNQACASPSNKPLHRWMVREAVMPVIAILERCERRVVAKAREAHWIGYYSARGDIFNVALATQGRIDPDLLAEPTCDLHGLTTAAEMHAFLDPRRNISVRWCKACMDRWIWLMDHGAPCLPGVAR